MLLLFKKKYHYNIANDAQAIAQLINEVKPFVHKPKREKNNDG